MVNIKKFTGGALINGLNVTYPMATLSIDDDQIILTNIFSKYIFNRKSITSIKLIKWFPLIMQGVRISGYIEGVKSEAIFWSGFNYRKVRKELRDKKYI